LLDAAAFSPSAPEVPPSPPGWHAAAPARAIALTPIKVHMRGLNSIMIYFLAVKNPV
jgi:hypothetical protein